MADIIPNQNLGAKFATHVGENLGTGLAQGLQRLAQNKVKEIERGKTAKMFEKTFNLSPQDAETYAMLHEVYPQGFQQHTQNLGGGTQPALGSYLTCHVRTCHHDGDYAIGLLTGLGSANSAQAQALLCAPTGPKLRTPGLHVSGDAPAELSWPSVPPQRDPGCAQLNRPSPPGARCSAFLVGNS